MANTLDTDIMEATYADSLRRAKGSGTEDDGKNASQTNDADESFRSTRMAAATLKKVAENNAVAKVVIKGAEFIGIDVAKWFQIIIGISFGLLAILIFLVILAIGYFITVDKWTLFKMLWLN